jgi:hypothetical protein
MICCDTIYFTVKAIVKIYIRYVLKSVILFHSFSYAFVKYIFEESFDGMFKRKGTWKFPTLSEKADIYNGKAVRIQSEISYLVGIFRHHRKKPIYRMGNHQNDVGNFRHIGKLRCMGW